ncbi:unnamed protein product [Owenia fusiformis]|uniref:Uncharacterized protein n=1 Tax=Owenia fusiformis TaxID=6347 RepID=A0A8J1TZL9_OWEFU|nr:unnamed protein product [Owenia fusiformis]
MQALQLSREQRLSIITLPKPQIVNPTDVQIRVAFCAVCGTDLHIIKKHVIPFEKFEYESRILGHEFTGIVTAIGETVRSVCIGDRVAIDPNTSCGRCKFCLRGRPNHCEKYGKMLNRSNGGLAEYVVISEPQVYKLSKDGGLGLAEGVICEPMSCIVRGWDIIKSRASSDSRVLINGAGIIGLLWTSMLYMKGFRNITVSEPSEFRREITRKLGLNIKVRSPTDSNQWTDRYDLMVDCSGSSKAIEAGLERMEYGGAVMMFAVYAKDSQLQLDLSYIQKRELTVMGSIIDPFTYKRSVTLVEDMYKSNMLNFDKLGVKVYSFEDFEAAFKDLDERTISKAVFKIQ